MSDDVPMTMRAEGLPTPEKVIVTDAFTDAGQSFVVVIATADAVDWSTVFVLTPDQADKLADDLRTMGGVARGRAN